MLYVNPSKWPTNRAFSKWKDNLQMDKGARNLFPRHSIWMPNWIRPKEGPVRGPLLFGDILSFLMTTPECVSFRLDTIKLIQARLENKESAMSEETLGAIMTLAMWEVCPNVLASSTLRRIRCQFFMLNG